jgi:hypothetical protein
MSHAHEGGQASDEASGAATRPTPAITNRQLQSKDTPRGRVNVCLRVRSVTAGASLSRRARTTISHSHS